MDYLFNVVEWLEGVIMHVTTISLNCTAFPWACGNLTLQELAELYAELHEEPLFIYGRLPNIILIAIYVPLFLIALLANLLLILTVSRYKNLRK